jgi:hypothetical protein
LSNFTPGPWTTNKHEHDEKYQDILINGENRAIARIWIDDAPVEDYNREQEANARLIVAAPDLLQALSFAKSVIQCGEPWTETCEKVIQGAINKALGKV